jgi:GTP pyrophosphokinase
MDRIATFKEKIGVYDAREQRKIIEALEWAAQYGGALLDSGSSNLAHPLEVADILMQLNLDADTLIAALLFHCATAPRVETASPKSPSVKLPAFKEPPGEEPPLTSNAIQEGFGKTIALLVEGMVRIADISAKNKTLAEAEHIGKMLFAMAKDIRVIFIKLADKLAHLRTLDRLPREQRRLAAQECLDIYAPLADRLGISWIKTELEDISLKQLNREAYQQIKKIVALKRNARNEFLAQIQEKIQKEAETLGFKIEISSRAKHFYSIYQKMRKRNKTAEELFDLFGLRIFCDTIETCYTLLGMVHRLWKPLEGRFKDYIAIPKSNGYQSLHTTVMTEAGELLEIQIRTREMHHIAEYGVASHWLYKKGATREIVRPVDISIVNRLRDWNQQDPESSSSESFWEDIKREILKDSIYVFTPQGKVIELPAGATAIDFAYSIHSAIGDHCMAAKADGVIIPLSLELKNTQMVEILTATNARPHLNWLRIAKTAKARHRIRAWLQQYDSVIIEKNVVAKKKPPAQEVIPKGKKEKEQESQPIQRFLQPPDSSVLQVKVEDKANLMIRFAQCCRPVTGDPIVGYVSRGRGIIVHRKNCRNLGGIPDLEERKIDTEWAEAVSVLVKRFKVAASLSTDLFSEIEGAVRKYGHLIEGRLEETSFNRMTGFFTVQLEHTEDLKKVIKNIRGIPAVFSIWLL